MSDERLFDKHDSDSFRARIEALLRSYRCQYTLDDDGNGSFLIDVFSPLDYIDTAPGKHELHLLADFLASELAPSAIQAHHLDANCRAVPSSYGGGAAQDQRWNCPDCGDVTDVAGCPKKAPSSSERPTLDKPAQIGGTVFHAGVSERMVIERAQREYEYQQAPEREAERMKRLGKFVEFCQHIACTCNGEMEKALCRNKDRCANVETFAVINSMDFLDEPDAPEAPSSAKGPA